MAWYDPRTWVRSLEERKAMSSYELCLMLSDGARSASGINVTWKTALQASVALACVRVIAQGLSQIPFRLMRADGEVRLPAADHALYPVIEWRANAWQTSTELIDQVGMHLALCGNAYVWCNRVRGRIVEMFAWPPNRVAVERKGFDLVYEFELEDGRRQQIPATDVWHLRGPSWEGWIGLDVVDLARETIGLSLAGERGTSSGFANGSRISGILTTDANLSKEQRDQLRESWQAAHAGARNAGKIAVMSGGMKFQPMQATAQEAQVIEQRQFAVEEVCRAFGVAPVMVGYSDKATTYASAEAMFQSHVTNTMAPWYRRIERSAAVNLLTEQERADGYYFKFFTQGLMRGSVKDRSEYYRTLWSIGAISPNEIRGLEDMNPYAEGDEYRVPLNTVDVSAADEAEPAAQDATDAPQT